MRLGRLILHPLRLHSEAGAAELRPVAVTDWLRSGFGLLCSGFDLLCSGFDLLCSGFDLRCSGFYLRCSGLDLLCSGLDLLCSGLDLLCSGLDLLSSGLDLLCSGLGFRGLPKKLTLSSIRRAGHGKTIWLPLMTQHAALGAVADGGGVQRAAAVIAPGQHLQLQSVGASRQW